MFTPKVLFFHDSFYIKYVIVAEICYLWNNSIVNCGILYKELEIQHLTGIKIETLPKIT